ncbi:hypothetical protein EIP86_007069 [Pleurotus ostreatoroseus]|nr:hypothetical protein EIP86_007069 [Pleurotus ostreatoroseus]
MLAVIRLCMAFLQLFAAAIVFRHMIDFVRLYIGPAIEKLHGVFRQKPKEHTHQQPQWLLHVYSPPIEDTATPRELDRRMRELWRFLGPDRTVQYPTWSFDRKLCAHFYSLILCDIAPGPTFHPTLYIEFGFCVARDSVCESQILQLYRKLIHRCTFEEFCDAFESSTLFALIERKNVMSRVPSMKRSGPPRHFKRILSSLQFHESVWDLKQYILGEGVLPYRVLRDYGFLHCTSSFELSYLIAVYKTAFSHQAFNEMELHAYCIRGKISEYVAKFQRPKMTKMEKAWLTQLTKECSLSDVERYTMQSAS